MHVIVVMKHRKLFQLITISVSVKNLTFERIVLPNRFTAYVQRSPTPTVFAKLRVNCGALDEESGHEGIAHFVEHVLMNGGTELHSPAQQLRVRKSFPYSNAHTTLLRTTFEGGLYSTQVTRFLEYLAALVFSPRFDGTAIERERPRILREISDRRSAPSSLANQRYLNALTSSDLYGRSVLGQEEIVSKLCVTDLTHFYEKAFCASNCDLFLVGNLSDSCVNAVARTFGKWPAGRAVPQSGLALSQIVLTLCRKRQSRLCPIFSEADKRDSSDIFLGTSEVFVTMLVFGTTGQAISVI